MSELNEHIIKKTALSFLKNYYKFRERLGETNTAIDMQSKDGIVVDGLLSFPIDDDGKSFSVTLEATSYDSADEVKYQILDTDISWDGVAFSSIITGFLISMVYVFKYSIFQTWGLYGSLGFVLILLSFFILLYYLLFKGLSRYHYIYAIEQFKQYDADEQWVAIASNIFPNPRDPFLEELKKQCVYNGMGLLMVNHDLEAQMIITPGREEVLKSRRKKKTFFSSEVQKSSTKKQKQKQSKVSAYFSSLFNNKEYNINALMRYRKNHLPQLALSGLGLLMIGSVFYKEVNDGAFAYVNELNHAKKMAGLKVKPEPRIYNVDSASMRPYRDEPVNYLGKYPDGLIKEDNTDDFGWVGLDHIPDGGVEVILSSGVEKHMVYDCERLFNMEGNHYLVQDGRYKNLKYAKKRLNYLNYYGLNANCVWMRCFTKNDDSYLVFIDLISESKDNAMEGLSHFNLKMDKLKLKKATPKVTRLRR